MSFDPLHDPTIPSQAPRYYQGRKMFGGRYTLLKRLGSGGMGVVWLAQDNELGIQRALKFAPPEVAADARSVAMLKREAIAGTSLAHPHIVRIFDFAQDTQAGETAVVMEVVEGKSLADLQAERIETTGNGYFEPEEIKPWLQQAAAALDYAHAEGRAHRDLKPQNFMIETATGRLKIMDFGISRRIGDSHATLTGKDSSGTLPYMSPQQVQGDAPSSSDDIYGLGATLYDLPTGSPPFIGGDIPSQVREKPPTPLNQRRAEANAEAGNPIPAAWEQAVLACLSKKREDRPQSTGAVQKFIEAPSQIPSLLETKTSEAANAHKSVTTGHKRNDEVPQLLQDRDFNRKAQAARSSVVDCEASADTPASISAPRVQPPFPGPLHKFHYTALNHAGQTVAGELDALNEAAAIAHLRQSGLYPTSVTAVDPKKTASRMTYEHALPSRSAAKTVRRKTVANWGFAVLAISGLVAAWGMLSSAREKVTAGKLFAVDSIAQEDAARQKQQADDVEKAAHVREEEKRLASEAEEAKAKEAVAKAVMPTPAPPVATTPATAKTSAPFENSLGMKFVPVPIAAGDSKDQPVLFSIWETRSKDYAAFVKDSGYDAGDDWKTYLFKEVPVGRNFLYKEVPVGRGESEDAEESSHPVANVSNDDGVAFCAWLTKRDRASGLIGPLDEYRLPTDTEWSYAVGIGEKEDSSANPKEKYEAGKTKLADTYPWGGSFTASAISGNYADTAAKAKFGSDWGTIPDYTDGYATTSPVGSFKANSLGIYDLGGNLSEWTSSAWEPGSKSRVLRGASWFGNGASIVLSSCRVIGDAGFRDFVFGFRCVLVVGGG